MKKKKILFLSPLPPPKYGSAMSSQMCLKILKKSKEFRVKNIKLNYSKSMSDIGQINISKIKGIGNVSKKIKKDIKSFRPDMIYFVPATTGLGFVRDYYFSKILKKTHKGKIIYHLRSRVLNKSWKNPFFRKAFKKMFKDERAIVLDKNLKKDLHGTIPKDKIYILPNAIENTITEKEIKKSISKKKKRSIPKILFLSNMDKSKGWFKLLKSCKILKQNKTKFKCYFVGNWNSERDKKKFFDYVKKNKLKNCKYLGSKYGKDKKKILLDSDILVFPTEYKLETFGRVIIEGMMAGLPVIANGIAAIPTTIQDGKTGFVLKYNTPEEIAKKIEELKKDKNKRIGMGRKGRKRFLKEYCLKKYKNKFLGVVCQ